MKVKMLMFAKTSLQSFMYDITDVFYFPDDTVKTIYGKYQIKTCFLYQNLTDTDSTSLSFIFICNHGCSVSEKSTRNIIFEVLTNSKLLGRLNLSHNFWNQFGVQNKTLKKQVGLYEIESIDNPNILTISINPKEYFEKNRNHLINKKHKGLKKDTPGMEFEADVQGLSLLHEFCDKQKPNKIKQKRFQIVNCAMQMVSVNKTQFTGLNGKRLYFHDGIVCLPFGHYQLNDVRKQKEKYRPEIQYKINKGKCDFLTEEAKAVCKCERLRILRSRLSQPSLYYLLNSKILMKGRSYKSTREHILNSSWK